MEWRNRILVQLKERNNVEQDNYLDIITQTTRLCDMLTSLRSDNLRLNLINEKLRLESPDTGIGSSPTKSSERIQFLEQKLLTVQEELMGLHRQRSQNAQLVIDLNEKLQIRDKELQTLLSKISDLEVQSGVLKSKLQETEDQKSDLMKANQTVRDEHQALHLAFSLQEENWHKIKRENMELLDRLMSYKARDADMLNEENETFVQRRRMRMQQELEEAAREARPVSVSADDMEIATQVVFCLPSKPFLNFDAHDSEVTAVRWNPSGRLLATGGGDRKVKLWDVSKGVCESRGILTGSNQGIMSIDFDSTGTLLLAASNDFATRVWTIEDFRLRHTLTGHSNKVYAARFLGESNRIVTGSHDRTLKIWDLRSRSCIATKFAGSVCNDVAVGDGGALISGHQDKKIRFWDSRVEGNTPLRDMAMPGKVTSITLCPEHRLLLCCVRDESLLLAVDMRMCKELARFREEGMFFSFDFVRAALSPDSQYCAVGGTDGTLFCFNVSTGKLERNVQEHKFAITAVAWNPQGTCIVSVDRGKKAIAWADF